METAAVSPRVPWLAILFSPRRTTRAIVAADPSRHVWILGAVSGIGALLAAMSNLGLLRGRTLGDVAPTLLIDGPILGLVLILLGSRLLSWSGQAVLSGRATELEVRAAVAWVSSAWTWIGLLSLARAIVAESSPELADALGTAAVVVGLLASFALLHAYGEVQQFSAWKSLAALFVALLALVLVLAIPVGSLWLVLEFV